MYAQTVGFSIATSDAQEQANVPKTFFVEVSAAALPAVGNTFTVTITDLHTGSASALDYTITSPANLVFTSSSQLTQAVLITIKPDADLEPDETIKLGLTVVGGATAGVATHTVTIKDASQLTSLIPRFLLSVGTNFDYLDQTITLKSLNFGANAFLPQLNGRFGLTFGFNQNRSFSFQSDSAGNLNANVPVGLNYLKYTTDRPIGKDSVWAVRQYRQVLNNSQIDNTSAYLGFTYLWKKVSNDNFKVYWQGRGEVLRRKITTEYKVNILEQDTLKIPARQYTTSPLSSAKGIQQTSLDGYFGAGLYAIYKNDDFWIRGQVLVGYTGHSLEFLQGAPGSSKVYYYCEGSITENKVLGLTFGVEVRGYMPNYAPTVGVTLSKVFTLNKLTDFIKAPGG
ncbi:hypothetical protein [Spirosoma pollinicola]|nr:hypothetical protein [Spirosoma pollinicola]